MTVVVRMVGGAELNVHIYNVLCAEEAVKIRKNATIIVETTKDVESLVVTDDKGKEEEPVSVHVDFGDIKQWTLRIMMKTTGKKTHTVTAYGSNGEVGNAKRICIISVRGETQLKMYGKLENNSLKCAPDKIKYGENLVLNLSAEKLEELGYSLVRYTDMPQDAPEGMYYESSWVQEEGEIVQIGTLKDVTESI